LRAGAGYYGQRLQIWDCNGQQNQRFNVNGVFSLYGGAHRGRTLTPGRRRHHGGQPVSGRAPAWSRTFTHVAGSGIATW
jgi:hypothetical protein